MKIAVATLDGVSISQHFGQSKGFVVFDTEDGKISSREFRTNNHTPHAQGLCNHEHGHHHGTHNHGNVLELLGDCAVVLCGGMGAGAAQALRSHGIEPFVLAHAESAEEAVNLFLAGNAVASTGLCNCHH